MRRRLPAEWSNNSAVILSWPHKDTDWDYMLDEVTNCYINIARALSTKARLLIVAPDASAVAVALKGFVDRSRYTVLEMPTNDTWARDFGMLCTRAEDGTWLLNDFKFNGWGLKFAACYDNLINRHIIESGILNSDARYKNRLGFVLEGGSIDIDEDGVMMTTSECLLSPNRNGDMSKDEIDAVLAEAFGCAKTIWLEHGALAGDDTDSHIDTLARFLPGHKIAYTSCDRTDDMHYDDLSKMEQEIKQATDINSNKYELISLPIPDAIYDADGLRLPATYANFLIINGTIFMPIYGDEKYDRIATEKIKAAMPLYDIVAVDCRALIQQHGSLHCLTMQIPDEILN